jgi:glycosyltransferase involved in cell wall biosynthesis
MWEVKGDFRKGNMYTQELVSIIIPTYNHSHMLPLAIKSALNQTYKNIELIIVDDGSTDNTEETVKGFIDPRIQYIRHAENKGLPASRNTGIKASNGEFVAFLDSDDEFLPEKIDENVRIMSENDGTIGLVCSNCSTVNKQGGFKAMADKREADTLWHTPSPSTWLVRKEVFGHIGLFDVDFLTGQDREFLFRFHFKFRLKYINKPLVIRHKLEGKLSSQTERNIVTRKIFLRKHEARLKSTKKFLAYQLYRLGKDLYATGHKKEAGQYLFRAFILRPGAKCLIVYMKCLLF